MLDLYLDLILSNVLGTGCSIVRERRRDKETQRDGACVLCEGEGGGLVVKVEGEGPYCCYVVMPIAIISRYGVHPYLSTSLVVHLAA